MASARAPRGRYSNSAVPVAEASRNPPKTRSRVMAAFTNPVMSGYWFRDVVETFFWNSMTPNSSVHHRGEGINEVERIHGLSGFADFVMKVRARGDAAAPQVSDEIAARDELVVAYREFLEMAVKGGVAVSVRNDDQVAVT